MLNRPISIVSALALAAVITGPTATAAPFFDDFNGAADAAPDSTLWTAFRYDKSGTGGKVTLDGTGNLFLNVNKTNGSHYVGAVTNAADFNPFTAPLTIELDDIALGGTPAQGSNNSAVNGWIAYGRSNASSITGNLAEQYRPARTTMAFGVGAVIRSLNAGYRLTVSELSDLANVGTNSEGWAFTHTYDLVGSPTGLTMTIDGANKTMTVSIEGTTFADLTTSVVETLSDDFTAANLSTGGDLAARIALGADNASTTGTPATFTVGSINVTVPEPASLALLGAAGLVIAARRRRD